MGDANPAAEADIGARALLGLAAGRSSVRLPRLSGLSDHAGERAGPEPPPLQLPTPAAAAPPPLFPAAPPSLALPLQHAAAQAHQPRSHLLPASHLHPTHDLPRPTASSFLPPTPARQDLPGIASLSGWPEHSQYSALSAPSGTAFDPIRSQEPEHRRLAPLPDSAAILSRPETAPVSSAAGPSQPHLASAAPWQPTHRLPGADSLPSASTAAEYVLRSQTTGQWSHPHGQHVAYPYTPHATHAPTSSYYYYQSAAGAPPSHLQPPHPNVPVPPPSYSIPTQHSHQGQSVIPPPLALPLGLPHTSTGEPSPALGAKVPSVHDMPNIGRPFPGLEAKYLDAKGSDKEGNQGVLTDDGKAQNIPPSFPELQMGSSARDGPLIIQASAQLTAGSEEPKQEQLPKRKAGLADLMNPIDKMPGSVDEPESPAIGMKGLAVEPSKHQQEIPVVADSLPTSKSTDLAHVKGETDVVETGAPTVAESVSSVESKKKEPEVKPQSPKRTADDPQSEDEREIEMEDSVNNSEEREDENADSEETRCPCGSSDNSGFMIACDECNTWQHGKCMGFRRSNEVPEKYYCNLCKPDEVRHNCIAHPKYKEKHGTKEREKKEPKRETDALLAGVKPIELRKHFAADLKQKRTGARLSKSDLFNRYATLLRNQFVKHRQSVVDGLVVVLDMQRDDVVEKLDSTLKRLRSGSAERGGDDQAEKRRGASEVSQGVSNDQAASRAQGGGRSNPQKRARPSSLAVESSDGSNACRADPHSSDGLMEMELCGDAPSNRGMTREERKLQQTMKLFARMEEREREKKKPRTGEAGTSPRPGQYSRPKTPRTSSHPRSVSPKSTSLGVPAKSETVKSAEPTPVVKEPVLCEIEEPQRCAAESPAVTESQSEIRPPQQQAESRKGATEETRPEPEPIREQPKRERENKTRERSERISLRRRETASPETININNSGRRKGILDRERSQESKRRRLGSVAKDANARPSPEREETKRDESLDFRVHLPGPSVLGSRKIIPARLSTLERERLIAEDDELQRSREARGSKSHRKGWLLTTTSQERRKNGTKTWKMHSPAKKRYRPLERRLADMSIGKRPDENAKRGDSAVPQRKGQTVSVSMVVVSEKGNLPDKGQKLEASRLILPETVDDVEPDGGRSQGEDKLCLKKRPRMYPKRDKKQDTAVKDDALQAKSMTPSSPVPLSPHPRSPPFSRSSASPRVRSPMLRSSPVPSVSLGLRSVSPPPVGKIPSFPLRSPSPSSRKPSPLPVATTSPSGRGQKYDNPHINANRGEKATGSAVGSAVGKDDTKAVASKTPLTPRGIPLSKPRPAQPSTAEPAKSSPRMAAPIDRKDSTPGTPGIGFRSKRSVPVSEPKKTESKRETLGNGPTKEARAVTKSTPPLTSSKPPSSGETTISDIFQQRLEGFLKPPAVAPREIPNGVSSPPNAVQPSKGLGTKTGNINMPARVPNGVVHSPLSSYRGKLAEQNGSWRGGSSYGATKKPPGGLNIPKSSQTNGPLIHSGRISPSSGDRGHFRSRSDPSGRIDDLHGRGRIGGPPWGSHGHKNGWLSGNGRGSYLSKDSNPKSNRRGRY